MMHLRVICWGCAWLGISATAIAQSPADSVTPTARYAAAAQVLERFIAHEMADKALPALSIGYGAWLSI